MTMHRRTFLATITTGGVASLAGCVGAVTPDEPGKRTSTVTFNGGFEFEPANIEIATGTTVTWINKDQNLHTVTAASDNWSKDTELPPGERTTHTFQTSGVYVATCTEHAPDMKIGVGNAAIQNPVGRKGPGY